MRTLLTITMLLFAGCSSDKGSEDFQVEELSGVEAIYSISLDAGLAAAKKKDWPTAIKSFTDAIEVKETSVAFSNRALAYDHSGQPGKAIEDHDKAVELDPNDLGSLYNRAKFYTFRNDHKNALIDFDTMLKIDPAQGPVYSDRGRAHLALGNYRETLEDFINAWRLNRDSSKTQGDLAWLLATCPDDEIRNGQDAVKFAQLALKGSGNSWQYVDTLAAAYAEIGGFDKAVETQQKAIESAPEDQGESMQERLDLYRNKKAYHEGSE